MAFHKLLQKKSSRGTLSVPSTSSTDNDDFEGATLGGILRSSFDRPTYRRTQSYIPQPINKRISVESSKFKNLVALTKYNQAQLTTWSNNRDRRPTDAEVEACVTALINYIILKQYLDLNDVEMEAEWPGLWDLLMALLKVSEVNWVTRIEGLSRVPEGYYEWKAQEESDKKKTAKKRPRVKTGSSD